jgi:hypothetical protein
MYVYLKVKLRLKLRLKYMYVSIILLVYWLLWSGSFLGGHDVMNSCVFTCVISHLTFN